MNMCMFGCEGAYRVGRRGRPERVLVFAGALFQEIDLKDGWVDSHELGGVPSLIKIGIVVVSCLQTQVVSGKTSIALLV